MKKIYLSLITALFFVSTSFAQTVIVAGADAGTLAGNPYTSLRPPGTSSGAFCAMWKFSWYLNVVCGSLFRLKGILH